MSGLVTLARWEMIILLGGLAAIVFFKLLTGGIKLSGLLSGDRQDGSSGFSPGRAQLLVFTVLVALNYLIEVIHNPSPTSLPGMSPTIVGALGGSQALYLGGKAWSLLRRNQG